MHYYQHNIGDYARDTGHLTVLEHGIYRLLLDWCYLNEKPITTEQAIRVSRGNPVATQSVLSEFFLQESDGWTHKRVVSEIAAYHEKAEKNRINGAKGGKRKPNANPLGTQVEARTNPNQEPITNNQEPIINTSPQAAHTSPFPSVITIPLVNKTEHPITQEQVLEWSTAYPAVDVMQQLRNMRQWCIGNPSKRKTARGINAFIVRWLTSKQDKGGEAKESFYERDQRLKAEEMAKWAPGIAKKPMNFANPFEYIDMEPSNVIAIESN